MPAVSKQGHTWRLQCACPPPREARRRVL